MAKQAQRKPEAAAPDDPYLAAAQRAMSEAPSAGRRGTYLRLPAGVRFTNMPVNRLFRLFNLAFKQGKFSEFAGQLSIVRYFGVHYGVGPNDEAVFCTQYSRLHNSQQPCAICQEVQRRLSSRTGRLPKPEWDAVAAMKAKDRAIRLVYDLEDRDRNNLLVFEDSVHNFDKFLLAYLQQRQHMLSFANPTPGKGKVIEVTGSEETAGEGRKYTEYNSVNLVDLDPKNLPPNAIIEKAKKLCVDDWFIIPDPEKLQKLVHGHVVEPATAEEDAEPPVETEPQDSNSAVAEPETEAEPEAEVEAEPEAEVEVEAEPEAEPDPEEDGPTFDDEPEPEPEPSIEVGSKVKFKAKGGTQEGIVESLNGETAAVRVGKAKYPKVKISQLELA
jgi:hypothetical protein